MRTTIRIATFLLCAASAFGQTAPDDTRLYRFPTAGERFRGYAKWAFGPGPITIAGVQAGIWQNGNKPPEWQQGGEGYARRFASAWGERFIADTARYGLGEALHQDVTYHKCACRGFFPRAGHALKETYIARTSTGRAVPSIPVFAGAYAGSMTAVYGWYPNRFGWKDGVRLGSSNLISRPVLMLVREFLP